jgi:hypothetical protein
MIMRKEWKGYRVFSPFLVWRFGAGWLTGSESEAVAPWIQFTEGWRTLPDCSEQSI